MTKAAEVGRGTFTAIGSTDQVASRMGELFAKLQNPAMTDITATFEGIEAEDITPNPMPDLYSGEPVVLTAQLPDDQPAGKLQIIGKTGDQPGASRWISPMPPTATAFQALGAAQDRRFRGPRL